MTLPDEGLLVANLCVRNKFDVTTRGGSRYVRVGCEFIALPGRQDEHGAALHHAHRARAQGPPERHGLCAACVIDQTFALAGRAGATGNPAAPTVIARRRSRRGNPVPSSDYLSAPSARRKTKPLDCHVGCASPQRLAGSGGLTASPDRQARETLLQTRNRSPAARIGGDQRPHHRPTVAEQLGSGAGVNSDVVQAVEDAVRGVPQEER
jgi:hypothetical protein